MHPSTDDLQDWEYCGKTPRRVPAEQTEMRMYSVLPLGFPRTHFVLFG